MIILLSIWSLMDEKQKTRLLVTCKSTISANASNDLKVTKKVSKYQEIINLNGWATFKAK